MQPKDQQNLFHVFTGKQAAGNPALVTLVDTLPTVDEHNLLITSQAITWVYIAPNQNNVFDICWFKNGKRIQRCGHGTLAAAAYLQNEKKQGTYIFQSYKEILHVTVSKERLFTLTMPAFDITMESEKSLPFTYQQLGQTKATDGYFIATLADKEDVHQFVLTNDIIEAMQKRVLIITARSWSSSCDSGHDNNSGRDNNSDIYSDSNSDIHFRYFAPQYGNAEDSATGSAASILWPLWSKTIKKEVLHCYQASPEGGYMTLSSCNKGISVTGEVLASFDC